MTTKEAIWEAIKTVDFDINLSLMSNDKKYYEGYNKAKEKLEEAMKIIREYDLI